MSTENITNNLASGSAEIVRSPNQSISNTIVTRRNQQVFTQEILTSRKIIKKTSGMDNCDGSISPNLPSIPVTEVSTVSTIEGGPKTIRTTTTKTYRRKIIRRTDQNGQVSEEIIEEGDPICGEMLSLPPTGFQGDGTSLGSRNSSMENIPRTGITGSVNFAAQAGFTSVSDTGEQRSGSYSTGPIQTKFGSFDTKMITDSNMDGTDSSQRMSDLSIPGNGTTVTLPDGSTVTRKIFSSKTATVTQSSTINGETKTSTKSAFVCYTGESVLQANSAMTDMENIFKEMTAQLKIEGFDVLNHFMLSESNNVTDHMALAGGSSGSSLFAIEGPEPSNEPHDSSSSRFSIKKKPTSANNSSSNEHPIPTLPSRESIIKVEELQQEEVRQKIIAIKEQKTSNRLYWSTMDEVKLSGILNDMKKEEIHLQEGIFEIITSEASYNISLDILIDFYYKSDLLNPNKENAIINSVEKNHLFSNILLVKGVSLQFLRDLETRWTQSKPRILDLADIILKHAEDNEFEQQYVNYLANQSFQINSLRNLLQKEPFKLALESIQSNPKCCKLSLDSFLALPMQRLTRLKLLLDVVLKLMNQTKDLYNSIPEVVVINHENALKKVKELLCKSEAKKFLFDQNARLNDLTKILEYGNGCKIIENMASMELIREGEFRAHVPQLSLNALKKLSKKRQPSFYFIVLSEFVIIAKKKSATKFVVLDYCARSDVEATKFEGAKAEASKVEVAKGTSREKAKSSVTAASDNQNVAAQIFTVKFGKSESGSLVEPLLLVAPSEDVRDQWINAIMTK